DHLFHTVDDVEVAVVVHADNVTCTQPAVPNDRGGLVRPLPVAVHDVRAAKTQLPRLARTHVARSGLDVDDLAVNVRQREPDRSRLAASLSRVRVRHGRRLGQAVPLEALAAGERPGPL